MRFPNKRLLGIALLLLGSPLFAATYYVSNSGLDTNSGTASGTPWLTVAHVNAHSFSAGDSILFQDGGTWRELLTIPSSGTVGNPITFGSYGSGAQPIISGSNVLTSFTTSAPAGVTLYSVAVATAPNIVLRDGTALTQVSARASLATGDWYYDGTTLWLFDDPASHTITAGTRNSAMVIGGKSYVTVMGIRFTEANQFGINMSQELNHTVVLNGITSDENYADGVTTVTDSSNISTGLVIENSVFGHNGSSGLNIGYATGTIITANSITGNGVVCSDGDCGGIYVYGTTVTGLTISNNLVTGNGGVPGISGNGIWVDTIGSGSVITGNSTSGNRYSGISVENTSGAVVSYNLSYGNGNNGIQLNEGSTGWVGDANLFYNNVCYGNTAWGLASLGNTTANTTTNNLWKNNISYGNTGGQLRAISGGNNDGTEGHGNVYTYNALGVAATNFIEWGSGVHFSTYAAWEAATGNCGSAGCAHSLQSDPLLVNAAGGVFVPQTSSPALGSGADLGSAYRAALIPSAVWPGGVVTASQGTAWNMGAYILPVPGLIEPTPPMGYNSWLYGFTVLYPGDPNGYLPNETRMHAQADALVSTGLAALGYTLMSVDAGWNANPRAGDGSLTNNATGFPSGMPSLGTYFHSRGLLYGLYGSPGALDCINWPGQYTHETTDSPTLASWGVDYWKNDLCSATTQWGSTNADVQAAFQAMGTPLAATGRPIAYHVNAYSANNSVAWGATVGGTSVRIGSDNDNVEWYKKAQSLDGEDWNLWRTYQHKGYWLDPDVLMFQLDENNNGGGSTPELVGDVEGRSQFNWYALIAAPLLIGTDVSVLTTNSLTTLRNTEVIAVDQDSLGLMGYRVSSTSCGSATCAVWARQLQDGWAIGFFNFDPSASHDISALWTSFGGNGPTYAMRDLWAHASVGSSSTGYTATAVPAMGSTVIKLISSSRPFAIQGLSMQGVSIQ